MSTPTDAKRSGTAEQRFRNAFERLKGDEPIVLPKGTPVSQNNVAKEASCDPSALRKTRFPLLVMEIQAWLEQHQDKFGVSARQKLLKHRKKNRDARTKIVELELERDYAQGLLNDANLRIVELTEEVKSLRAMLNELRPSATVHNILDMDTE